MNAGGDFSAESENPAVAPMSWFEGPRRPLATVLELELPEPPPGVEKGRHLALVKHFQELLGMCFVPRPSRRVTPESALTHKFFEKGAGS